MLDVISFITWQPVRVVAPDIGFYRKFCLRALCFLKAHYVRLLLGYILVSIFLQTENDAIKTYRNESHVQIIFKSFFSTVFWWHMSKPLSIFTLAHARRPATFHDAILKFHEVPVESFASLAKASSDEPDAAFLAWRSPDPPSWNILIADKTSYFP